ncbi:MAG: hypothetical protein ACI90V_013577 [Bacillariaceae sp.]|jgi:hypothetical protein
MINAREKIMRTYSLQTVIKKILETTSAEILPLTPTHHSVKKFHNSSFVTAHTTNLERHQLEGKSIYVMVSERIDRRTKNERLNIACEPVQRVIDRAARTDQNPEH